MDTLYETHNLVARAGGGSADPTRPPVYKVVGLCLAIASGLFIGVSFVLKKVGLLKANEKYNEVAGEGYGYLKNFYWWAGMTLMIVGEICNFVAYAFVDAILVTPLGALSVVVTTILSAIFLKERLSFVGKIGCFNCIVGSVVIVLNAPEQSAVADIQQMQKFVISPGFLSYAGVIIVSCIFIALWVGPRYGKKSMLVYLSICSLIGGLSVVATQGLGSAVVAQAGGKPQFNQWFLYVLLVFVVATLLTEIIYLNKALNLFNAALVTPTYYVFFTSSTIIASAILFRGFKGTPISITTVIMGFLQICAGVVLLQLSKSAKDVPDAAVFKGDLNQVREVANQEQPETEPKADAIRGAAAIVRRLSSARQKMEAREFERLHQEKLQDHLEPLRENEVVEWDGLRRRKTVIGDHPGSPIRRRQTTHPPLGMSQFPEETEDEAGNASHNGILAGFRDRASTVLHLPRHQSPRPEQTIRPVALEEIEVHAPKMNSRIDEEAGEASEHTLGLPADLRKSSRAKHLWSPRSKPLPPNPEASPSRTASPPNSARRQFSFTNFMSRNRTPVNDGSSDLRPPTRTGLASRGSSYSLEQKRALKNATEEERLGLVKGDTTRASFDPSPILASPLYPIITLSHSPTHASPLSSSFSPDETFYSHQIALPTKPSPCVTNVSDSDSTWQMTNQLDCDRTVTITETPTVTVAATAKNLKPRKQLRLSHHRAPQETSVEINSPRSPPPTYQQVQAQSLSPVSPLRTPPIVHELHHARHQDQVSAPESTWRGQEWEQESARRAQESALSQSLSTSQNPTTAHINSFRHSENGRTKDEEEDGVTATNLDEDSDNISRCRPEDFYNRPMQQYRSVSTPVRRGTTSYSSHPASQTQVRVTELDRDIIASPEIHDPNSFGTKARFQEQSKREREKRRMRMSMR